MIDKAIEVMDGRHRMLGELSTRTVGLEVMQERPAPHLEFGGAEVSMKVTGLEQTAGQGFHVAVDHIPGAMSLRIVESQREARCFHTPFMNGFQSRTG